MAVAGHDQVRLDEVGALFDGQFIGRAGVLRPLARGAAVGDDERLGGGGHDRLARRQEDGGQDGGDHGRRVGAGRDRRVIA
ncbi:hypothetical protein D3C80_1594240 [compost metagenome]